MGGMLRRGFQLITGGGKLWRGIDKIGVGSLS